MHVSLSGAAAVIASAGALFFALGYVVTNARLASYGVNELAPPSARFVAVGMLSSVFLAAAYLVPYVRPLQRSVRRWREANAENDTPRSRRRRLGLLLRALAIAVVVLGLLSALEAAVIELIAQPSDDRELGYLFQFLVAWNTLPTVGLALLPLTGPWYRPTIDLTPRRSGIAIARTLAAIPILLLALALFAQSAFKYIPQWAGGGRLFSVQVLLAESDRALCPECEHEGAAYVLSEDGERIVLFLNMDGRRRVVEIPRGLIRAIVHPPRP